MDRNKIDIILLLISRITRSITAGFLAVVIGLYFLQIGLSLLQIGVLFGVSAFASPLIAFIFSIFADIQGRKIALLITLSFLPISILILLLTNNFYFLALASALGGFGIAGGLVGGGIGATVAPIQTAILAEKASQENRTKIYSIFTLASTYAGAGGALLSYIKNYDELFVLGLVLSLISFIVSVPIRVSPIIRREKDEEKNKEEKNKDLNVIKKFTYTGIFNGIAQGLITPFIPVIFEKFYSLTQPEIGLIVFFGGIVSATVMFLTPYFTELLGFVKFIIITRGISSVLVLIFPFLHISLLAEIDYVLFTTFRVFALPSQQALMMNLVSERRRATASGINQTARLLPSAVSTTLSGFLLTLALSIPFISSFIVNIVNLFLYYKFFWDIPEAQAKKKVKYVSMND
ncbi:MFS transporter [Sulfurisphaera ohwakuensis]|uniref:MFS family permease n=1 Tax=Sulfurisphaera ohwakuensis TaxID=69656 RepID=A0A650CFU4_SULOH|nr:MFS transporter [Sulfurisphaera ohwakuensis]MBB5254162.1 MFS family permease [Sulfurisphaera ohwakuensis]QGR16535.1 MFS transporter [Sulfurisphaera ohwakuensis]